MTAIRIMFAVVLLGLASLFPCAAADFEGQAAYQELLRADPSNIVEGLDGVRYVRAPRTRLDALPGGYKGGYSTTRVPTRGGGIVEVIDPAQALQITRAGGPTPLPERVRKIVAGLEKNGLVAKVTDLPQAVGGHGIAVTVGEEKPGQIWIYMTIYVGEPAKLQKFHQMASPGVIFNKFHRDPLALGPRWGKAEIGYPVTGGSTAGIGKPIGAGLYYWYGEAATLAIRLSADAVLYVIVRRFDSETIEQFNVRNKGPQLGQAQWDHCVQLSNGLKPEAEKWTRLLAKIIDDADDAGAPVAAAPPTPPVPPPAPPPPAPVPPVTTAVPPPSTQPKPPDVPAEVRCPQTQKYLNQAISSEERWIRDLNRSKAEKEATASKIATLEKQFKESKCDTEAAPGLCDTIEQYLESDRQHLVSQEGFIAQYKDYAKDAHQRVEEARQEFAQLCQEEAAKLQQERDRILQQFGITEQELKNLSPDVRQQLGLPAPDAAGAPVAVVPPPIAPVVGGPVVAAPSPSPGSSAAPAASASPAAPPAVPPAPRYDPEVAKQQQKEIHAAADAMHKAEADRGAADDNYNAAQDQLQRVKGDAMTAADRADLEGLSKQQAITKLEVLVAQRFQATNTTRAIEVAAQKKYNDLVNRKIY